MMNNTLVITVREALDSILPVAVFAPTDKSILPIYGFVLLKSSPKGLVALSGNGAQFLLKNVSPNVTHTHEVCLDGAKLRAILTGYKDLPADQSVTISWDETGAVIKSGRSKLTLNVVDASTFPSPDKVSPDNLFEVVMPSHVLRDSVNACIHAVGQKDARFYLNGMCFKFSDDKFSVVSTDGHRLSRVLTQSVCCGRTIQAIVPKRFLDLLSVIPKGIQDIRMRIDSRMIELTWLGGQIRSQLVDGQFPETDAHFAMPCQQMFKVPRQELISALNRLRATVDDKRQAILIGMDQSDLTQSGLRVATEGSNKTEITGEDFLAVNILNSFSDLSLNINYLNDCLNSFSEPDLVFSRGDKGVVLITGQDSKIEIISPINR